MPGKRTPSKGRNAARRTGRHGRAGSGPLNPPKGAEPSDDQRIDRRLSLASHFRGITRAEMRAFLVTYAQTGNVMLSCQAASVDRRTHYNWLKQKEYQSAFAVAYSLFQDRLEAQALQLAVQGLKRKKFHQGVPIIDPETGQQYSEIEYHPNLLMFMLKRHIPEYRDANLGDGEAGGASRKLSVTDVVKLAEAFNAKRGAMRPQTLPPPDQTAGTGPSRLIESTVLSPSPPGESNGHGENGNGRHRGNGQNGNGHAQHLGDDEDEDE